jgi:hypothetical protein
MILTTCKIFHLSLAKLNKVELFILGKSDDPFHLAFNYFRGLRLYFFDRFLCKNVFGGMLLHNIAGYECAERSISQPVAFKFGLYAGFCADNLNSNRLPSRPRRLLDRSRPYLPKSCNPEQAPFDKARQPVFYC